MAPLRVHIVPSGYGRIVSRLRPSAIGGTSRGILRGAATEPDTATRRGTVTLFCIIVNALLAVMAIGMLNSLSLQASRTAAIETTETAEYLAQAGVEASLERLQRQPSWTGTLNWNDGNSSVPSAAFDRRYTVTVAAGQNGDVVIRSEGRFGAATRSLVLLHTPSGTRP